MTTTKAHSKSSTNRHRHRWVALHQQIKEQLQRRGLVLVVAFDEALRVDGYVVLVVGECIFARRFEPRARSKQRLGGHVLDDVAVREHERRRQLRQRLRGDLYPVATQREAGVTAALGAVVERAREVDPGIDDNGVGVGVGVGLRR